MANSPEEVKKSLKLYGLIGGVLFICTILTVAVATVPWMDIGGHGFDAADMWLGFAIATVKAGLVMMIFMHMNHEKRMIYFLFALGILGALFLMFLTALAFWDPIVYKDFLNPFD